ncbi:hypothetical protein GCM10009609_26660 [Pseudonocardia aurantiaca]|uniref:Uncharacterized protein n=1 Tax=Pseudonocardia aurantiaca TaxID=75290 RepID=A0ABW4FH53_9PSEU
MPSEASDPVLDHELGEVLRDLETAEPPVPSTPRGIDYGAAPGRGASPWQLWEISTPAAGER